MQGLPTVHWNSMWTSNYKGFYAHKDTGYSLDTQLSVDSFSQLWQASKIQKTETWLRVWCSCRVKETATVFSNVYHKCKIYQQMRWVGFTDIYQQVSQRLLYFVTSGNIVAFICCKWIYWTGRLHSIWGRNEASG